MKRFKEFLDRKKHTQIYFADILKMFCWFSFTQELDLFRYIGHPNKFFVLSHGHFLGKIKMKDLIHHEQLINNSSQLPEIWYQKSNYMNVCRYQHWIIQNFYIRFRNDTRVSLLTGVNTFGIRLMPGVQWYSRHYYIGSSENQKDSCEMSLPETRTILNKVTRISVKDRFACFANRCRVFLSFTVQLL